MFNIYVMTMHLYLLQNTLATEKGDYFVFKDYLFHFAQPTDMQWVGLVSLLNSRAHKILNYEDDKEFSLSS